ncbi:hypothetical protein L3X38_031470 [Prunus dulcis]|uniref:Uncharacterized protein n=1 Tax=Prunus dulcis TaxID=3755 RepID=A0AAD4VCK0_PRUDU|nr:hypothetical protein L3X38_031470 [Prunus dulcis]
MGFTPRVGVLALDFKIFPASVNALDTYALSALMVARGHCNIGALCPDATPSCHERVGVRPVNCLYLHRDYFVGVRPVYCLYLPMRVSDQDFPSPPARLSTQVVDQFSPFPGCPQCIACTRITNASVRPVIFPQDVPLPPC